MGTLRFLPEAIVELDEAAGWYAARSQSAAQNFVRSADRTIDAILESPTRFAAISQRDRSCRVAKYPYHVVYRIEGDVVLVVAVAHAKRRPGYWRRRR